MKTNNGIRIEIFANSKSARELARDIPTIAEYLNSGNKGNLVIHSKGIWHLDIIVKGKGHRKQIPDLALLEEIRIREMMEDIREAHELTDIFSNIYEEMERDAITREMASLWGIE